MSAIVNEVNAWQTVYVLLFDVTLVKRDTGQKLTDESVALVVK
jgi:hypothetical protein